MKSKFIKLGLSAAAFVTACLPMSAMAAAPDNTENGVGTIPVTISVAATPIKASVPTSVAMVVAANSNDAVIADGYSISNDAAAGALLITDVEAAIRTGWTLVANTEDFANMPKDSHKLYLGVGVGTDNIVTMPHATMSSGGEIGYAVPEYSESVTYAPIDKEIAPGTKKTIRFEAKTGAVSTALSEPGLAQVVVTMSQK